MLATDRRPDHRTEGKRIEVKVKATTNDSQR